MLETKEETIVVIPERSDILMPIVIDGEIIAEPKPYGLYVAVPILFLVVTLLGGLRIDAADGSFIFLKPALICMVFAAALAVLYIRSGTISIEGWVNDRLSLLQNIAHVLVLLTLFTASTQLFNSLLPEAGLPLWVVGFCIAWTLGNNLFVEFDDRRLFRSLGGMFALAFIAKYLILANLTSTGDQTWLQRIWQNPAKEAFTWLLDLPRFASATGYIQFFTLVFYLIGLYLTPRTTHK